MLREGDPLKAPHAPTPALKPTKNQPVSFRKLPIATRCMPLFRLLTASTPLGDAFGGMTPQPAIGLDALRRAGSENQSMIWTSGGNSNRRLQLGPRDTHKRALGVIVGDIVSQLRDLVFRKAHGPTDIVHRWKPSV